MKTLILLLFLSPLTALAQDTTTKKLEEVMSAYNKAGHFNGSVLVAVHGNILLQNGYGIKNAEEKSFNDKNTIYQIASVTKQFTATVILKLIQEKRMTLQDKLSKYYKGFHNGDSITIEQLLTHTSGLHNFTEEDTTIAVTDEQHFIPYLQKLKPDFAPGAKWNYSNTGYVMLGFIIQKVSGMSYWQAVRKYIFDPLQMQNSGFDFAQLSNRSKAVGYDTLNDTIQQRANITDSSVPFGAGAIYSTVGDLYKWHKGLQDYRIIDSALMNKAYTACALSNYGYGWQIDSVYGRKMVSHSGAISGFGSNIARIPADDICIVLLSNKSGSTFDVMHITNKLLAVLYNQPYAIPKKRTAVTLSTDIIKQYVGTYEVADMHVTIEVSINDNTLIAQPQRDGHPGPTSVMLAADETHFFDSRDDELEITFNKDDAGNIKGMTILQADKIKFAQKIK
ncbi:serine hydrolase [Panacibacter ginsenosidivorans]|uniref:Serine hydrolase n=1 Tax=Panacibacter ginsenosidivorans TaxID=1813871 RepID=A0A5B8V6F1_9BACT|nr:serine hydrolase [Panacibacter ginsenosidivorans]QEC66779.1 serine hydrolase [Panacibacter ginsenosidivorans]